MLGIAGGIVIAWATIMLFQHLMVKAAEARVRRENNAVYAAEERKRYADTQRQAAQDLASRKAGGEWEAQLTRVAKDMARPKLFAR